MGEGRAETARLTELMRRVSHAWLSSVTARCFAGWAAAAARTRRVHERARARDEDAARGALQAWAAATARALEAGAAAAASCDSRARRAVLAAWRTAAAARRQRRRVGAAVSAGTRRRGLARVLRVWQAAVAAEVVVAGALAARATALSRTVFSAWASRAAVSTARRERTAAMGGVLSARPALAAPLRRWRALRAALAFDAWAAWLRGRREAGVRAWRADAHLAGRRKRLALGVWRPRTAAALAVRRADNHYTRVWLVRTLAAWHAWSGARAARRERSVAAVAWAQERLLRRATRGWRLGALAKRSGRLQSIAALAHAARATARRAVRSWAVAVKAAVWEREIVTGARSGARVRAMRSHFGGWRLFAARRARVRRSAGALAARAISGRLAHRFRAWQAVAARSAWAARAAVAFRAAVLLAGALNEWRDWLAGERQIANALARADAYAASRAAARHRAVLAAWHGWAATQRRVKRKYASFLRGRLLPCVFALWRENAAAQRWDRVSLKTAEAAAGHQVMRRVLRHWARGVADRAARRARSDTVARPHAARGAMRRVLLPWAAWAARNRDLRRRVAGFLDTNGRGARARAFAAWAEWWRDEVHAREATERAAAHAARAALRAAWRKLAGNAAGARRYREGIARALAVWKRLSTASALRAWACNAGEARRNREGVARALVVWKRVSTASAFRAWVCNAGEARRYRATMARAVVYMTRGALARAYAAWAGAVLARRAALAAAAVVIGRLQHGAAAAAFAQWTGVTRARRASRARLGVGAAHWRSRRLRRGVASWAVWARRRAAVAAGTEALVLAVDRRVALCALRAWRAAFVWRRDVGRKMMRYAAALSGKRAATVFFAWVDYAARARRDREAGVRAAVYLRRAMYGRYFAHWAESARHLRITRRIVALMGRGATVRAMRQWRRASALGAAGRRIDAAAAAVLTGAFAAWRAWLAEEARLKRVLARAMALMRCRSLSLTLRAWAAWTRRSRAGRALGLRCARTAAARHARAWGALAASRAAARRVAPAVTAASAARSRAAHWRLWRAALLAVSHARRAAGARAMHGWAAFARTRAARRYRCNAAAAVVARGRARRALLGWADVAAAGARHRAEVARELACDIKVERAVRRRAAVSVGAAFRLWRATVAETLLVDRFRRSVGLLRAFTGWTARVAVGRVAEAAAQRGVARARATAVSAAFVVLAQHAAAARAAAAAWDAAEAHSDAAARRRALRAWASAALPRARAARLRSRVAARVARGALARWRAAAAASAAASAAALALAQRSFGHWRAGAAAARSARATAATADAVARTSARRRALAAWRAYARGRVLRVQQHNAAVAMARSGALRRHVAAWRARAREGRAVAHATAATAARLRRLMSAWGDAVRWRRAARGKVARVRVARRRADAGAALRAWHRCTVLWRAARDGTRRRSLHEWRRIARLRGERAAHCVALGDAARLGRTLRAWARVVAHIRVAAAAVAVGVRSLAARRAARACVHALRAWADVSARRVALRRMLEGAWTRTARRVLCAWAARASHKATRRLRERRAAALRDRRLLMVSFASLRAAVGCCLPVDASASRLRTVMTPLPRASDDGGGAGRHSVAAADGRGGLTGFALTQSRGHSYSVRACGSSRHRWSGVLTARFVAADACGLTAHARLRSVALCRRLAPRRALPSVELGGACGVRLGGSAGPRAHSLCRARAGCSCIHARVMCTNRGYTTGAY